MVYDKSFKTVFHVYVWRFCANLCWVALNCECKFAQFFRRQLGNGFNVWSLNGRRFRRIWVRVRTRMGIIRFIARFMSLLFVMDLPISVFVSLLLFMFVSMPGFASLAVSASMSGLISMSSSFPFGLDMVFRVTFPKVANRITYGICKSRAKWRTDHLSSDLRSSPDVSVFVSVSFVPVSVSVVLELSDSEHTLEPESVLEESGEWTRLRFALRCLCFFDLHLCQSFDTLKQQHVLCKNTLTSPELQLFGSCLCVCYSW